jgi:uncharacterized membrane protein
VLVLAMLATLPRARAALPFARQGIVFAAVLASVGLIFLLEYLTWTPLGSPVVEGVQGRYFMPLAVILPAYLPAIPSRMAARVFLPVRLGLLAFPAISVCVMIIRVVHRYYI